MTALGNNFEILDFKTGSITGAERQYSRTYAINASSGQLDDLMRNTANATMVNSNTLAKSAGIIGMSSDARSELNIEGGYEAPRCAVFLKARNKTTGDVYLLTGYTTTDFMSPDMRINPHAMISFTDYTEFSLHTNSKGENVYRATNIDSLLTKQFVSNSAFGTAVYERPKDVLTSASVHEHANGEMSMSSDQLYGCSSARNAQPDVWFGQTLNALTDAAIGNLSMNGNGAGMGAGFGSTLASEASQAHMIAENIVTHQPFIGSLINSIQSSASMEITWSELQSRLPGLRNFIDRPPAPAGGSNRSFESWNNRDSAMVTSELATAIPAIMRQTGISYIRFRMTNQNYTSDPMNGNRPLFSLASESGFGSTGKPSISFVHEGMDYQYALREFESRLAVSVFNRIANGHKVSITIDASIVASMVIAIEYDGYSTEYSCGTFAHARWSAMTATGESHSLLAGGMSKVAEFLSDSLNGINKGSGGWDSGSQNAGFEAASEFGFDTGSKVNAGFDF